MATAPPTDPSLRRGVKTSEFMLTAVTVLASLLGSFLVLVDAIAPAVPPKYEAILAGTTTVASALLVGLYALGRNLAKAAAASSVPAYLEALKPNVAPFNVASGGDVTVNTEAPAPVATDSDSTPTLPEGEDEAGIDPDVDPATLT